jgi:hypothetical protein
MSLQDNINRLIALLDVSEKRYPSAVASLHVNQACAALSEDNDLWFDRFIYDYNYVYSETTGSNPNTVGVVPFSGIVVNNLAVGFIRNIFWLSGTKWKPIDSWEYREALLTHNDVEGEPENAVIFGGGLALRPIPNVSSTVRLEVKGKPTPIGLSDSNGWLDNHPFAVLYRAAMYAAIYMMEDNRLATFTAMFKEEAERAALHGSMMVMSEPRQAQEPG